jgi:23S rRNA pseudouridine2605 synthase
MPGEERIQKIIASAGIASRRKAEALMLEGRVTVNGQVVTELGTKADPERDFIKVDGRRVGAPESKLYILLNKPRQVVSTVSDPEGRLKVTDLVREGRRLYPVGRLDYNSEGLLLLTNDGEFARVVSKAGDAFPKLYEVKVRSAPDRQALDRLRAGGRLTDGTRYRPVKIVVMKEGNNSWFEVTLTEGKNQQIRKMFDSIGHPVMKLRRRKIGFLTDAGLAPGRYRHLTAYEVSRILRSAGSRKSNDNS